MPHVAHVAAGFQPAGPYRLTLRRSGLPVPRRRTLAAGILPAASSVIPLLRHRGCAEESNAGYRDTGSPSLRCTQERQAVCCNAAAGFQSGRRFSTCGFRRRLCFMCRLQTCTHVPLRVGVTCRRPRWPTRQPSRTLAATAAASGCRSQGRSYRSRGYASGRSQVLRRQRNGQRRRMRRRPARRTLASPTPGQRLPGPGWPGSRAVTRQRNVQPVRRLPRACRA